MTWLAILGSTLLLTTLCFGRSPFRAQFSTHDYNLPQTGEDPGKPLFVTPYLDSGDLVTARKMALVGNLSGMSYPSYSGFFTVNKTFNSNMFFWYFPPQNADKAAPVLLWLQGGPGGSSLFGLFVETGPIGVNKQQQLFERKITWNTKYGLLYIDNPVGTGFSFTDDDRGYATDQTMVGENLLRAMTQFYTMFPELAKNDFYITGESYAGKYIPALAHFIHAAPHTNIPLKGMAIGDGWSDPGVMVLAYSDMMYQTGQLDEMQAQYFLTHCKKIATLVQHQEWHAASELNSLSMNYYANKTGGTDMYNYLRTKLWNVLLLGDINNTVSYYTNATGSSDYFNFLRTKSPAEFGYYNSYVNTVSVRRAIHVGNLTYNSGSTVEEKLFDDLLKSVKPWLAEAMDNYKVMLYNGQLDVIVGLPLTQAMLQTVPWRLQHEYTHAPRSVWKLTPTDTEVAGYVRNVGNFYQVAVRGGGHILPFDQPERSWDMIDRFITGRSFKH